MLEPSVQPVSHDEGSVFEIFQQDHKESIMRHGGSLRAPDYALACHYAREFYGRRQESLRLWIIPRTAFHIVHSSMLSLPTPQALALEGTSYANEQVFALFAQKQAGQHLIWLADLAIQPLHLALATAWVYTQATECAIPSVCIWLCPRSAIRELVDPDLLQPPLDRSYRRLDGYNIREKLRLARQRALSQGEIAP